ncbi:MAG: undecaprenyl/decaprenyl-phosphate alpha-N-acetylglucosaminyl 1-phosphate transferase [Nitrospira sp.]|nr:undecaprenyl/decaprenyl-phosphate alpha-N-acetylglucosaminyl 1-phosphate transferase [Nitrospira sp.]MDH4242722.1 undecaprenyl/decaprenyl-phosphate alpha-N-acetylglucosaminyl 1-phosphate transferase [Nitrospira sp.]MDH4354931.1 undecaprenyl/decaprenyl-phosphate alpha-N-acetylglucosaminyl 1-phosphate transferase [Nitrospira sp.]MDH5317258.1 undecaprenyl/decaprenyl-phosphate alpha-N-acetylglucosaminyl 1-phosphate transferase [Nitrospira sp.]
MINELFFSSMTALLLCMGLIPLLRLVAERFQVMDLPGERKVHAHPIPRIGGVAFAIGACASIAWWGAKDTTTISVLLGCMIIVGFGVWDDRVDLGYRTKLVGQLLGALVVVWGGDVRFTTLPFLSETETPVWLGSLFTIIFLIGVSNAVNLTDGLDGLAGGLSFLTLSGIAYLAYLSSDSTVLMLTVPFLGALLGFLRYNTYPARIFMGDGGSQLLGFIMGVLVILLTDSVRGPFSPTLSLFLLGLPFLDTLGVTGQRLAEGRSPFVGDRAHVHHKLLRVGLTHYEAVTAIYLIQASMLGVAYVLRWESDTLILPLYLLLAITVLMLFIAAGRGLLPTPSSRDGLFVSNITVTRFMKERWLTDLPIQFLAVAVPLFLIALVFLPSHVPNDVGYLSMALFGIVLLGLAFSVKVAPYFVRGGLYVGTTFLLYVSEGARVSSVAVMTMVHNAFFLLVAIMVLLSLRFNEDNRFQTTPLDYLMVFLAVTFPLLPEVNAGIAHLGIFAAKLIVLFFSFELLLHAFSSRVRQLGLVSLWILFGLGIRILL